MPPFDQSNWNAKIAAKFDRATMKRLYTNVFEDLNQTNTDMFENNIFSMLKWKYEDKINEEEFLLENWDEIMYDLPVNDSIEIYIEALMELQGTFPTFFNTVVIPKLIRQYDALRQRSPVYVSPIMTVGAVAASTKDIYSNIQNVGSRNVPANATNVVSLQNIENGTNMVNFHDEFDHGRYYTKNTFDRLNIKAHGKKENPSTRQPIKPTNVKKYKALVKATGGAKTRKGRKNRKATRKGRKGTKRRV